MTRYAWQGVWGRPGLEWKARRLIVLAITSALGRWEEFDGHLRGALTQGNGGKSIPVYLHPEMFALRATKAKDGTLLPMELVPGVDVLTGNGGSIVRPPFDVEGVGRIAIVNIPGAGMQGWMAPAPQAG